jgi:hypothetical protein
MTVCVTQDDILPFGLHVHVYLYIASWPSLELSQYINCIGEQRWMDMSVVKEHLS